jgi:hypothetical protein
MRLADWNKMLSEIEQVDSILAKDLNENERKRLWVAAERILKHRAPGGSATGLALGYVQSGKTTQMIALTAAAYDAGYRVVVALLGSTNLLLDQNSNRFIENLQIDVRTDFRWVSIKNPNGKPGVSKISENLDKDRIILIPVLKHKGRITQLAEVLAQCGMANIPTLILDDEADQASLNSKVNEDTESKIYEAIGKLRESAPQHLYVQFTATPYAQLLLEPSDRLAPEFVEFLMPGQGYVGGREFFIDNADKVVRPISIMDEQSASTKLLDVPPSLLQATANFIAGSALLLVNDPTAKTISMLVHSTHKNKVQSVYHFLMKRLIKNWKDTISDDFSSIPVEILAERDRLVSKGALNISDEEFHEKIKYVLKEVIFWLVNSASDVKKVNWLEGPIHILVGGNKLDRGFTVEGLTVTYMNRPTTEQIDTLEQRARAFGYRNDLLPYCQFFATLATIRMLRGIVHTEYDLRGRLEDWIAEGKSPKDWSREIGLLLPQGGKPTRNAVIRALTNFNAGGGWHQLRMPSLDSIHIESNRKLIENLGILQAPRMDFGRIKHRYIEIDSAIAFSEILQKWAWDGFSPGWEHEQILQLFESLGPKNDSGKTRQVKVTLMQFENEDKPREREWRQDTGFVNLFQGQDALYVEGATPDKYPGDRKVPILTEGEGSLAIQIHRILPKGINSPEVFTLAVYLGDSKIVRGRTI